MEAVDALVADYLRRFSEIAGPLINCAPILNWFELDAGGARQVGADDSDINTPAVAAALVGKRYVAQASDEISLEGWWAAINGTSALGSEGGLPVTEPPKKRADCTLSALASALVLLTAAAVGDMISVDRHGSAGRVGLVGAGKRGLRGGLLPRRLRCV
ncbi:Rho GTPase-activating protein 32 [Amphibalanus amphitrite]|uniref:Rho GTPase-activating protein 32 n=1 Tax=Amphibalanus amphitrite TaxID=1232801 RepID=A0A6A4WUD2_AMPAM|nr:Rho GTPase-activating protein 32 [Amphibalanus amphitrite]